MFRTWWQKLFSFPRARFFRRRGYRPPIQLTRRTFRLSMTALEDRVTPAFNMTLSINPTVGVASSTAAAVTTFTANATGANLDWQDIVNALGTGNSVVVNSGSTGTEAGNITDQTGAQLTMLPGNQSLTFQSGTGTGLVGNITIVDCNLQGTNESIIVSAQGRVLTGLLSAGTAGSPTALTSATVTATTGTITGGFIDATDAALSAATGIGTVGTPFTTQVSNLVAQDTTSSGIFVSNTGNLTIGFTGEPFAGVQVTGASGDIELTNSGNVTINRSNDIVKGPGNVTVAANGATANLLTGGNNTTFSGSGAIQAGGNVMLSAGQDILLGDTTGGTYGDVGAAGNATLTAGRDIVADQNSFVFVTGGTSFVNASAGRNISVLSDSGPTGINSSGGAITLTTGAGGVFTLNAGTSTHSSIKSNGGNITISADDMAIQDVVNGGAGIVTLRQAGTTTRNVDLGLGTTAGDLGLSVAELAEVTAGILRVGRTDNAGNFTITAPIPAEAGFSTLSLISGGSIAEAAAADTITVTNLAIRAATGVNLDTVVSDLAVRNATSGNVRVANTGPTLLTAVDGLDGSAGNQQGNFGGATTFSAASPFTYAISYTSAGTITTTTTDDGPIDTDDITVNSGVTVTSTGGDVVFDAGDDVVINGTVQSQARDVDLVAGFNDTDNEGVITINGTVSAVATVTLNVNSTNSALPANTPIATETATSTISAAGLLLLNLPIGAPGPFNLNASTTNAVGTIAGSTNSGVNFRNAGALTIGSVTSTPEGITSDGILSNNHAVSIQAGGTITVAKELNAGTAAATLNSTGGNILQAGTLTTTGAAGGAISLTAAGAGGINLQVVTSTPATAGVTASTTNAPIILTSTQQLQVDNINAGTGDVTLHVTNPNTATSSITSLSPDDNTPDVTGHTVTLTADGPTSGNTGQIGFFTAAAQFFEVAATTLNASTNNSRAWISLIGGGAIGSYNVGTNTAFLRTVNGTVTSTHTGNTPDITAAAVNLSQSATATSGAFGTAANPLLTQTSSLTAHITAGPGSINVTNVTAGGNLAVPAATTVSGPINLAVNGGNLTTTATTGTDISAPGSIVTLTASGGIVSGSSAGVTDVSALSLAMTAGTGIGSASPLKTVVTNLAFHNTGGNVAISNTGALTINSVGSLTTSDNTGGTTTLSAASPMTYAVNTTSAGTLTATTADNNGIHVDNITVNSGVTVTSTGGDVVFDSGDDVVINGTVQSQARDVDLVAGFGDSDNEGVITINGTVSAVATVTLNVNSTDSALGAGTPIATEAATASITGAGLLLLNLPAGAPGVFSLDASTTNAVGTIAATTHAGINFRNDAALTVGTVTSIPEGITSFGILTNNNDTTLCTITGDISLTQGLNVGTGTARLQSAGAVTQNVNGKITAANLGVNATGNIALDQANPINHVPGTVALNTTGGSVAFQDDSAFTTGTIAATGCFTGATGINGPTPQVVICTLGATAITAPIDLPGGTLRIQAGGAVTQTAAGIITAANLGVNATGTINLCTANNDVGGTFAANASAGPAGSGVMFLDTSGFTVGTITASECFTTDAVGVTTNNGDADLVNTAGSLTLLQGVSAGTGTVRFNSAGGVAQTIGGAGSVTSQNLAVLAAGAIDLAEVPNHVTGIFAAQDSANAATIQFTEAANVGVTAGGTIAADACALGATGVASSNGDITITADNLTVASINAGSASVTLQQESPGQLVNIGGADAAGTLGLSQTDLANVTARVLRVGRNDPGLTGTVSVTAPITLSTAASPPATGVNTLVIRGGGTVVETGTGTLTVRNLAVQAAGPVGLTGDNHVTTLAGQALAAGQDFDFTEAPNTLLTIGAVDIADPIGFPLGLRGVVTQNGNIYITSDNLDITQPVGAGTACVILQERSAATTIAVGGTAADVTGPPSVLGLSDADLSHISAAGLRIGEFGFGPINVVGNVTLSTAGAQPAVGVNSLELVSAFGINEAANAVISVNRLTAAGNGVSLTGPNDVRFFAGGTAAGDLAITNAPSAANPTGLLVVGPLSMCGNTFTGITAAGNVTVTADDLSIAGPISAPTFCVTLQSFSTDRNVTLDATATTGGATLSLDNTDLDHVTARVLRIGRLDAGFTGTLTVNGAIAPTGTNDLDLRAGGATSEAGTGTVTVANFAAQSNSTVTMGNANAVTTLAGQSNGTFLFNDGSALTVGTVDVCDQLLPGINSGNGDVTLCSAGAVTLATPITAGTGTVRIQAAGAVTQTTATAVITAADLGVRAGGTINLCVASNQISSIFAADASGGPAGSGVMFLDNVTPGFAVGTVTANGPCFSTDAVGVKASAGDVDLVNTGGSVTLNQAVTTGGQTNTVRINAGTGSAATITQAGAGTITALNLAATAGGTVNLCTAANAVGGTVAGSGSSFMFNDTLGFGVGIVAADACATGATGVTATSGDADLVSGGSIALNQPVSATGTVRINSGGSVTQVAAGKITSQNLAVRAAGTINLCVAPNAVSGDFAAQETGAAALVAFRDTLGFAVDTVSGDSCALGASGVNSAGGDADLVSSGAITLNQPVTATGATVRINAGGAVTQTATSPISSQNLAVVAAGNVDLSQANNAVTGTFAANDSTSLAAVRFRDTAGVGLTIGTVIGDACATGASGIVTNNGDVTVRNQSQNVAAETISIFQPITAASGGLSSATVRLQAFGDIVQNPNTPNTAAVGPAVPPAASGPTTGAITAANLAVRSAGGNIVLDRDNVISTGVTAGTFAAAAPTGNINFRNTAGLVLNTIAADNTSANLFAALPGVSTGTAGTVRLATAGGLTQTAVGSIVTGTLGVRNTTSGDVNLIPGVNFTAGTGNSVGRFGGVNTAPNGRLDLATLGALTLGPTAANDTIATDGTFASVRGITTNNGGSNIQTGTDFTAIDPATANPGHGALTPLISLGSGNFLLNPGQTGNSTVTFEAEAMTTGTFRLGVPQPTDAPPPPPPPPPADQSPVPANPPGPAGNVLPANFHQDSFIVRPSQNVQILVNGNNPTTTPGDSLKLFTTDLPAGTTVQFNRGGVGAGRFDFSTRKAVPFTGIEQIGGLSIVAAATQTGPNGYTITAFGTINGLQITGGLTGGQAPANPFIVSPNPVNPAAPFGAPSLAVGDFNGDGLPDLIIGNGPDNGPLVTVVNGSRIFNSSIGAHALSIADILSQFFAYSPSFQGGLFVAAGHLNSKIGTPDPAYVGAGVADPVNIDQIVTGANQGGGPHVRAFAFNPTPGLDIYHNVVDNATLNPSSPYPAGGFFAYESNFTGGVRVAVGDVNGDGFNDIVTGAGPGGGPHVKVFGNTPGMPLLASFYAYASNFTGGVYVAAGDYNQDGKADILTGAGLGGGPHVKVFSGAGLTSANPAVVANAIANPLVSFFAFGADGSQSVFGVDLGVSTGVGSVAFADVNGDGKPDIIVGSGRGPRTRIAAFAGNTGNPPPKIFFTPPAGPASAPSAPNPAPAFFTVDTSATNDGDLITIQNFRDGTNVTGLLTQ